MSQSNSNHSQHAHSHEHFHTNVQHITNKETLQARVSLHEMFRDFDQNGDGIVTSDDLKQIVGNELTQEEINVLIQAVNKKKDGKIQYAEFIKMMTL